MSAIAGALALRPYQEEAIQAVEDALGRGVQRPLVSLPCGTGKTVVFASLAARRGGTALVLAHRDELLRQAAEKLVQADRTLALGVGFVAAQRNDVHGPVVVGSIQTLARRERLAQLPRHFDTVVVDEAHHAAANSYRRIINHLQDCPLILGVTATPRRSDKRQLGDVWQELVYQRGILEMIRAGYLVDVRGVRVGLEVKLEEIAQSGGDFQADALGDALEEASAPRHVLGAFQRHAGDRKTVVFVPTVALAYTVAKVFRNAGIAAEALDGNTPPEKRQAILARLRHGATQVLVNVAVVTEGWDEPSISCVIVATPTRSQVKYTQIAGRALRPFPGKQDCLVIDVVGVSERLDLQTLPRLFNLDGELAPGVTVTEQSEREQTAKRGQPGAKTDGRGTGKRDEKKGPMRSRDVTLLGPRRPGTGSGRRRLHWLRHQDYWLVSADQGTMLALIPDGNRWTVLRLDRHGHQRLAGSVDLGYAQGIAEDYVRHSGAVKLADSRAHWRRGEMSDAQAAMLRRLGVTAPEQASKGEASDLIALAQGARRLDALTRRAA